MAKRMLSAGRIFLALIFSCSTMLAGPDADYLAELLAQDDSSEEDGSQESDAWLDTPSSDDLPESGEYADFLKTLEKGEARPAVDFPLSSKAIKGFEGPDTFSPELPHEVVPKEEDRPKFLSSPDEIDSIDTADLDESQGNWLFKRIWWQQAEERYEQVRAVVDRVSSMYSSFFVKNSDLEQKVLEPFYRSIGLSRAELQATVDRFITLLEQSRDSEGGLSDAERSLMVRLRENEDEVNSLKDEVARVVRIDDHVERAMSKLTEALNRIRKHERNAWNHFKEISRTLNDEHARESFFKIDEALRNATNVEGYVRQELEPYFERLVLSARNYTTTVSGVVEELQSKGIEIKKRIEKMVEQGELGDDENGDDDDENGDAQPIGFFGRIVNFITAPFRLVWQVLTLPFRLIFG